MLNLIKEFNKIYPNKKYTILTILDFRFKTTTRSHIFVKDEENYPIKERTKFNLDDVIYYLYNKTELEKDFDEVLVISEFNIKHKLTKNSSNIKL